LQKYAIFSSNLAGALPPAQQGVFLGWNYSNANAEACLVFNGSSAGLVIVDTYGQTWKERMRITSAGNVGIGLTNPQVALAVNGQIASIAAAANIDGSVPAVTGSLYAIATSNTQLTFRMRGSDGTWRQATLTLA